MTWTAAISELDPRRMALNAICPYFTMFPLGFPYGVLASRAGSNDWVLDPFCGRGTTNFAARLLGLPTIGIDTDSVAAAATEAKLVPLDGGVDAIVRVAREMLSGPSPREFPEGEFWSLAYRSEVLDALCRLREGFLDVELTPEKIALRGLLLGALHGPLRRNGTSSYFSNQAPRTYAPKPRYAIRFWRSRRLEPPRVNVVDIIAERAWRYFSYAPSVTHSVTRRGDSRKPEVVRDACGGLRPTWVITSPPYYGLRTYQPDQWLRQWFLGGPAQTSYDVGPQLSHRSRDAFVRDLRSVWENVAAFTTDDARLIVRFGAINDRPLDPIEVLETSLERTPWRVHRRVSAGTAARGRRQAVAFSSTSRTEALPEYDFWAVKAVA